MDCAAHKALHSGPLAVQNSFHESVRNYIQVATAAPGLVLRLRVIAASLEANGTFIFP